MADLYGLLTAADNNTQQNNDNEAYRQAQALQNTVLFDNLIKNISGNPIAANVAANLLSNDDKNNNNNNQQTTQEQEQEQEQLQEQAAQAANNLYQNTTTKNAAPSWLNDISGGYKENRNTPLSLANLAENTTSDGRQKGFAYRLGEGLGSLARIAESPLGRGLIMGGAVLADRNGDPLKALAYGTKVFTGNQANRLRDNTYRQQLEAEGIDTSKLGSGYLTDTTYQNTINTANKRKELEKKDRELDLQEEENKRKQIEADYKNIQAQYDIMEKAIKLPYLDAQTRIEIEQGMANLEKTTKENYGIDLTNENKEQDNYFNPILKSQEIAKNTQDYQWQPKLNQSIINRNNNAVDNSIALARLALAQNADNRANTKLQMDIDDKKKKDEERDAVTNAVKNLTGGNNTNTANRTGKKDNDPLGIR